MKKLWIVAGAILVLAYLAGRVAFRSGAFDWEKMFQRMPDTAPPKWMFNNIQAIRENTDKILERLNAEEVVGIQ
jgi:hypothetical protein